MSFATLDLDPQLLKALEEAGYSEPTSIQLQAIPKIADGVDIRASAQTGTGKTAAFLLPALNRLLNASTSKVKKGPRILIIVPTRELAMQIAGQAEKYSKYMQRVKTVCLYGGVPYDKQTHKLSRPYDVLIATPGRLIDFMQRRKVDFSRLEMLVLDEADRMLDMGFMEPVEQIVAATPSSRQTLLFSATLEKSVMELSKQFMRNSIEIRIHEKKARHENITQSLLYADDLRHKNQLLEHILDDESIEHTLVFTSTKRHADQLVGELYDKGYEAAALHGDMSQRQRTRTIKQLKNGKVRVLVATDVAARGIDVDTITHVINYDLPQKVEDYVHRIGRTGRAGAKGTAISFASGRDAFMVKKIEEFTGQKINVIEFEGLAPRQKKSFSKPPRRTGPNSGPRQKKGGVKGPFRKFNPKTKRNKKTFGHRKGRA